jgi:hypothetical protein
MKMTKREQSPRTNTNTRRAKAYERPSVKKGARLAEIAAAVGSHIN